MKVKTDYDGCSYITAGKVYEVFDYDKYGGDITVNSGNTRYINFTNCAHLDDNRWEVLDD